MSALTDRIRRDLDEIAGQADTAPTAWRQIEHRIATERANRQEADVVVRLDLDRRRGNRSWLLAVAVVVLIAFAGPLYMLADLDQDVATDEPAPPSATETVGDWSSDATGPGTFRTTIIEPGFTVTLGEAWTANETETVDSWSIRLPQDDQPALSDAYLYVVDLDADSADGFIASATERGFSFSEPTTTRVDGIAGQRYDVLGGSLDIMPGTAGAYIHAFTPHEAWRLTILEVGDHVVAIGELVPSDPADQPDPDEIEVWQPMTEEIVATIRWRDR